MLTATYPQWVVDPESLLIVEANAGAEEFWGCSAAELVGRDIRTLVPTADIPPLLLRAVATNEGRGERWRCVRSDGTVIESAISWQPFTLHGRTHMIVMAYEELFRPGAVA